MFPQSIQKLIDQLTKLPDMGPRAASRLAFFLINQEQKELDDLSSLIKELKTKIHLCSQCFNITSKDNQLCPICQDPKRDKETICLVENVLNVIPLEKTKQYHGLYHILGGLITPSDGIGPENLKIKELIARIKNNQPSIKEVIFALSPTTEGDTTFLYIERLLKDMDSRLRSDQASAGAHFSSSAKGGEKIGIKTSRLGRGLSTGSDLEYIDENTLTNALLGRR